MLLSFSSLLAPRSSLLTSHSHPVRHCETLYACLKALSVSKASEMTINSVFVMAAVRSHWFPLNEQDVGQSLIILSLGFLFSDETGETGRTRARTSTRTSTRTRAKSKNERRKEQKNKETRNG